MNPMMLLLVGQNELWDKLVKPASVATKQRNDINQVFLLYVVVTKG